MELKKKTHSIGVKIYCIYNTKDTASIVYAKHGKASVFRYTSLPDWLVSSAHSSSTAWLP